MPILSNIIIVKLCGYRSCIARGTCLILGFIKVWKYDNDGSSLKDPVMGCTFSYGVGVPNHTSWHSPLEKAGLAGQRLARSPKKKGS
jgi:hypothetical protein